MECHTDHSSISICRREETLPAPLQGVLCNGASRNPGRCPGLMCIGAFSAETPNDARSLAAERNQKVQTYSTKFQLRTLAGCGKTNFLMKTLSAPCDKTGFFPLVLPLWGRLQKGQ